MKKLVKFLLIGFLLNFTLPLDAGTVKIRQVGQPDVYVPTMDSTNSNNLTLSGGIAYHTRSVSSATILLATDFFVLVTSNVSVTLPAQINGKTIHIKRNTSAGFVTVLPGSGTIDGAASYILSANYQTVSLITDGTNWYVM